MLRIFELMELAYGKNFYLATLHLLAGDPPKLPARAAQAAAIRFLTPPPGRVRAVRGQDEFARIDGVVDWEVTVRPGDLVPPLRSSWDRAGHVVAAGPTPVVARERAEVAARNLRIVVD